MSQTNKTVGSVISIIGVIMMIIGVINRDLTWGGFGTLIAFIGRLIVEYG